MFVKRLENNVPPEKIVILIMIEGFLLKNQTSETFTSNIFEGVHIYRILLLWWGCKVYMGWNLGKFYL